MVLSVWKTRGEQDTSKARVAIPPGVNRSEHVVHEQEDDRCDDPPAYVVCDHIDEDGCPAIAGADAGIGV